MDKSSDMMNEAGESAKQVPNEEEKNVSAATLSKAIKPEDVKEAIKKAIEDKLEDIKDQVLVDIFEGGVRIQLVDKAGKPMFDLGSSHPTPLAIRILQVIGDNIKNLPNPTSVEGHTDSVWRINPQPTETGSSYRASACCAQGTRDTGTQCNPSYKSRGLCRHVPLIKEEKTLKTPPK